VAELVALYIVWKNIGAIARFRGVKALPYQRRAIILWFVFEFACGFVAAAIGMQGILVYLAAVAGAVLSLHFSFKSAREAVPKRRSTAISKPETGT
jgi:hypothetical protein